MRIHKEWKAKGGTLPWRHVEKHKHTQRQGKCDRGVGRTTNRSTKRKRNEQNMTKEGRWQKGWRQAGKPPSVQEGGALKAAKANAGHIDRKARNKRTDRTKLGHYPQGASTSTLDPSVPRPPFPPSSLEHCWLFSSPYFCRCLILFLWSLLRHHCF